MTFKKKIFSIILVLLLAAFIGSGVSAYGIINSVTGKSLDLDTLGVNHIDASGIINVALFGIDGRDEVDVEGDRADTIMIASVNFDTGDIKIVSVMRDLIVQIPDTDVSDAYLEKINAAYAFGGCQAEIRALNDNFDLNISDYAIVNFDCLVDTVDILGGVDVDVKNEDVLHWTNEYIGNVNVLVGRNDAILTHTGPNHLTGVQALGYCRNRYSDSDFGRTARQREVVRQIAEKAMQADLLTTLNLIRKVYPYVQTSFTIQELTEYAQAFLSLKTKNISTSRLPFDSLNTLGMIQETSYVIPTTLADNTKVLHYLLFGNESYIPSEQAQDISDRISDYSGYGSSVDWSVTTPQMILDNMQITAASDTGEPETEITDSSE